MINSVAAEAGALAVREQSLYRQLRCFQHPEDILQVAHELR
jgi:hypothetical protein